MFPRQASLKVLGPIVATAAILGVGILLFRGSHILWLPPVTSLLAIAFASLGAFSWVFFAEDRQRRLMLKALSKVVSPAVAEQLAREPQRLALGTVRTDLTVMFTDLENFTGLSESMDVQKLGTLLNRYLGEMSDQVLLNNGTLDKYIGDAIMCFWNAPLPQANHAVLACRAALAIARREREIQDELKSYGVQRVHTRIGINTTSVAVGFVGSSHLFNYTAVGDGVNLASRLEGANKLYGTSILLSETAAEAVKDHFVLRKIDVLRVKGKRKPMAVYELIAEKGADTQFEPLIHGYESAFALYQAQQWDQAQKVLLELNGRFADDKACQALLERIEHLRVEPPPADWDGVYTAKSK
jgi:adenylate cyclase